MPVSRKDADCQQRWLSRRSAHETLRTGSSGDSRPVMSCCRGSPAVPPCEVRKKAHSPDSCSATCSSTSMGGCSLRDALQIPAEAKITAAVLKRTAPTERYGVRTGCPSAARSALRRSRSFTWTQRPVMKFDEWVEFPYEGDVFSGEKRMVPVCAGDCCATAAAIAIIPSTAGDNRSRACVA